MLTLALDCFLRLIELASEMLLSETPSPMILPLLDGIIIGGELLAIFIGVPPFSIYLMKEPADSDSDVCSSTIDLNFLTPPGLPITVPSS